MYVPMPKSENFRISIPILIVAIVSGGEPGTRIGGNEVLAGGLASALADIHVGRGP